MRNLAGGKKEWKLVSATGADWLPAGQAAPAQPFCESKTGVSEINTISRFPLKQTDKSKCFASSEFGPSLSVANRHLEFNATPILADGPLPIDQAQGSGLAARGKHPPALWNRSQSPFRPQSHKEFPW